MAIEITGPPVLVDNPAFPAEAVRVPLSEEPTPQWLDHLRRQALPGKAHRIDGAAIEFYLDRDTRDLIGTMRRIATAIDKTNQSAAGAAEGDAQAETRAEQSRNDRRDRVNGQLQEWWEKERERRKARNQQ